jgi:hypothetical protein
MASFKKTHIPHSVIVYNTDEIVIVKVDKSRHKEIATTMSELIDNDDTESLTKYCNSISKTSHSQFNDSDFNTMVGIACYAASQYTKQIKDLGLAIKDSVMLMGVGPGADKNSAKFKIHKESPALSLADATAETVWNLIKGKAGAPTTFKWRAVGFDNVATPVERIRKPRATPQPTAAKTRVEVKQHDNEVYQYAGVSRHPEKQNGRIVVRYHNSPKWERKLETVWGHEMVYFIELDYPMNKKDAAQYLLDNKFGGTNKKIREAVELAAKKLGCITA